MPATRPFRWATAGLLALGVATAGVLTANNPGGPASVPIAVAVTAAPTTSNQTFTIGDSDAGPGLYPGAVLPRTVRVSNPNAFDITVTSITTTIGTPQSAGCPSTAVSVDPFTTAFKVPDKKSVDVTLAARMSATATNACKNTTFPVTYTAKAVKS